VLTLLAPQLPQLITNYKAQSADGLSMAFLFVWLLGDMTNLSGKRRRSSARDISTWIGCLGLRADNSFAGYVA